MEIITSAAEDRTAVRLLEAALRSAYDEGYQDSPEGVYREDLSESAPAPRELWEQLMKLVGVTV